jgi:hypothetical protein
LLPPLRARGLTPHSHSGGLLPSVVPPSGRAVSGEFGVENRGSDPAFSRPTRYRVGRGCGGLAGGSDSVASLPTYEPRDRDPRPDHDLRRVHRRRPGRPARRSGADVRLPRSQRGRQDHHHQDALHAASARPREGIGIVFQEYTLDDYLTAERNLAYHCMIYHVPRRERRAVSRRRSTWSGSLTAATTSCAPSRAA